MRAQIPAPIPRLAVTAMVALTLLAVAALPSAASAKVPKDFFGMSAVQPSTRDFKGMVGLGAGTYRIELGWPGIQTKRNGPFNFAPSDARIRAAASAGLQIVPILFGTPTFLSGDAGHIYGPTRNKTHRKEWQDFVRATMDRYRRGGEFWRRNDDLDRRLGPRKMILWNEQNARSFWWPKADPKAYGALLRKTRAALDKVDKRLKIVTGGMFGYPNDGDSINAKEFLKRLYEQKDARKVIDGVSVHPYAGGLTGVKKQVRNARKVMNRNGDRGAEIVIGETGWASGGNRRSNQVKSKKGQKRQLKKAYGFYLNKRREWKISSAYWFTYKDYKTTSFCLWCAKAGLVDKRGETKPSGKAYKRLVRKKTR